jgi:hypothetical protein
MTNWTYIVGNDEIYPYALNQLDESGKIINGGRERYQTEEELHARARTLVEQGIRIEVFLELGYSIKKDEGEINGDG